MGEFDLTRVQHEACPTCGHDVSSVPFQDLAPALTDVARHWGQFVAAVLDHPGGPDDLCHRPEGEVWSAVEYGCHVRDVLALFGRRVELTLLSTRPELEWWDHEAAAIDEHYAAQDAQAVADDLMLAATHLARLAQPLTPAERAREATRLGVIFTVEGLVRFALHEAMHHLDDARSVVRAPSA